MIVKKIEKRDGKEVLVYSKTETEELDRLSKDVLQIKITKAQAHVNRMKDDLKLFS